MTVRTDTGFPLHKEPSPQDLALLERAPNADEYVQKLFELYVRDTPFTQKDLLSLHSYLQDLRAGISYAQATVRRKLWKMRKEDLVVEFDADFTDPSKRTWIWAQAVKPVTIAPSKVKGPDLVHDPAGDYYARMLTFVFSK